MVAQQLLVDSIRLGVGLTKQQLEETVDVIRGLISVLLRACMSTGPFAVRGVRIQQAVSPTTQHHR